MEPYLKKAVRALVKKHNPEHFYQSNNPSAHEANAKLDDNAPGREFAISWYGIPDILK